ncbi:MFS transporter [Kineosporia sp. NBRC 101677]|nr:MFS transporter [Kineosporia sp. NBRC 101677]
MLFLFLAVIGSGCAQMSSALLTLSLKATRIDEAGAAGVISLATGVAGVFTVVALPLVGRLSDLSRSRYGRRRPWLLVGAASYVVGSLVMLAAANAWMLTAGNLFLTLGAVCTQVVATALIADQLPPDRRGPAAALVSLGTPLGALIGTGIGQVFNTSLTAQMLIPAVFALFAIGTLAVVLRDPQFLQERPQLNLREFLGTFWVDPVRHPGFALVFTSRMLVFSGVAAINAYQVIYLLSELHVDPARISGAVLLTVVINAGLTILVAPALGRVSDRLGVRKPFILVAAVVLGIGLYLASLADSLPTYLMACAVVALGQGVYFSVELALATQLLPDPDNPAKDLAIIKLADNLPVSIVAAVAPALLTVGAADGAQNYAAVFITGGISAVLGGLVILFIRAAR